MKSHASAARRASVCPHDPLYRKRRLAQPVLFPTLRAGGIVNTLTCLVGDGLLAQPFREPLRPAARRRAGLPLVPFQPQRIGHQRWPPFPIVHGFSEALVPRPDDWPSHLHVTGSWLVPPDAGVAYRPPLTPSSQREAPIYAGFGSPGVRDADRVS